MIMPIIPAFQLIKKEFSGTIRNFEDGHASVQSAIPLQSLPVDFADFFTKMFRGNDDKVVTLRKKLLLEVVCYFDFQSDTEFLSELIVSYSLQDWVQYFQFFFPMQLKLKSDVD